jgi:sugar transferase (PEP-CTERM/EpsH1 system associated)
MSLRVLFVTPYVPSSVRIRPLALIRELARRGHQVTLACLVQPAWEARYLPEVAPHCEAVHPVHLKRFEPYPRLLMSLASPVPLSVAYCDSPALKQTISQLLARNGFDLVHTEFVRAAPATIDLNGHPKVFDLVDCTTLVYRRSISASHIPLIQRIVSFIEWVKMRDYEGRVLRHYDQVLISSPVDRKELRLELPVEVLPNGVDPDFFVFHDGDKSDAEIIFLGKMSYYVNVASVMWFYMKVFPLIRKERPHTRLVIVGRNPTKKITSLMSDPSVEVTGTVTDVRPFLQRASVAICPMVSGAGIQNKMLEAMAVGTPCVATSLACQALQVEPGKEVIIANKPEDFAQGVMALLDQPGMRRDISFAARSYVECYHDWKAVGAKLEHIYTNLTKIAL